MKTGAKTDPYICPGIQDVRLQPKSFAGAQDEDLCWAQGELGAAFVNGSAATVYILNCKAVTHHRAEMETGVAFLVSGPDRDDVRSLDRLHGKTVN